jgi:pimeloyl-ACP methyl ester carboxylesterase
MIHGWGLDSQEWYYAKKELAQKHRLIVWDLPGLGLSDSPRDRDWSLEKMAQDLDLVIEATGFQQVFLVGHSIGGMIILTYCRLFADKLTERIAGLVLAQTTYTNPAKTTQWAGLMQALQKPLLEPMCHLMVWLSPLVWLTNWLSYLNGSAHRSTERSSFSGSETRGQLEFMTRYTVTAWPAVLARGFLGMFRYDATAVLPTIPVPTWVVAGDRLQARRQRRHRQSHPRCAAKDALLIPSLWPVRASRSLSRRRE